MPCVMCIDSVLIFCAVAERKKTFVEMKREELSKAIVHIATEQAVIVSVTLFSRVSLAIYTK